MSHYLTLENSLPISKHITSHKSILTKCLCDYQAKF